MFIHSGEKPFRCEQCNYSSAQAKSLKEHMLTHSGEKPFACIECNNTFTKARNLKQHMLLHSGEDPFRCKQCNYSFTHAQHLKEHMFRHTGVEPYMHVNIAVSLVVTRKDWNITCYHTLARNLFSVSSATTPANILGFWRGTWEITVERNWTHATSLNLYPQKKTIWGCIWKQRV